MDPVIDPSKGAADASAATPTDSVQIPLATVAGWMGLPETATLAEVEGKLQELSAKAGETTAAQTSLADLQAQRDALQAQYDALFAKQQELDKAQRVAEVEAQLSVIADRVPAEKLAKLKELMLSNPEAGKGMLELLSELPAPGASTAEAGKGAPPPPVHDPAAQNAPAAQDKVARVQEAEALIKAVQAEGKFKDYSSAREEARRRRPELFA